MSMNEISEYADAGCSFFDGGYQENLCCCAGKVKEAGREVLQDKPQNEIEKKETVALNI